MTPELGIQNKEEFGYYYRNRDTILDRAESEIFAISQKSSLRSFIPLKEALAESFDRITQDPEDRYLEVICGRVQNIIGTICACDRWRAFPGRGIRFLS